MISEESCDTEDWSNYAEYIYEYIYIYCIYIQYKVQIQFSTDRW